MRRALAGFVLVVALGAPAVSAQVPDLGRDAAVAPAQTLVDAAARVIALGLEESDRDGTPDAANRELAAMRAFGRSLQLDWVISPNATYRSEALAARAYGAELVTALAGLPEAAATTSVTVYSCEAAAIDAERLHRLLTSVADLAAIEGRVRELAASPPPGVDATRLAQTAARIRGWVTDYDVGASCATPAESFLFVELRPATTWPGGRVRVLGATNAAPVATIDAPALGLDADANVVDASFFHEFVVPNQAAIANHTLNVSAGAISQHVELVVGRAPSEIVVRGASTAAPATALRLEVNLLSPLAVDVENATILASGLIDATLVLQGGRSYLDVDAPGTEGTYRIGFAFAGSDRVAPAFANFTLVVASRPTTPLAPPPTTVAEESPPARTWMPVILVAAAVALVGVLALALGLRRRARARGADPARAVAAARALRADAPLASTLIALFAGLVALLRAGNRVSRAATAREVGQKLRGWGADPGDVVLQFERARYGGEPEPAGVLDRARAWLTAAWARIRGDAA